MNATQGVKEGHLGDAGSGPKLAVEHDSDHGLVAAQGTLADKMTIGCHRAAREPDGLGVDRPQLVNSQESDWTCLGKCRAELHHD